MWWQCIWQQMPLWDLLFACWKYQLQTDTLCGDTCLSYFFTLSALSISKVLVWQTLHGADWSMRFSRMHEFLISSSAIWMKNMTAIISKLGCKHRNDSGNEQRAHGVYIWQEIFEYVSASVESRGGEIYHVPPVQVMWRGEWENEKNQYNNM